MKKCPKCNKEYSERPAISREDNKTEICPNCGLREGLESIKSPYTFYELSENLKFIILENKEEISMIEIYRGVPDNQKSKYSVEDGTSK